MVKKLEREPGKRESRYVHLFSGIDEHDSVTNKPSQTDDIVSQNNDQLAQRVSELEIQVASLSEKVAFLTERLEEI